MADQDREEAIKNVKKPIIIHGPADILPYLMRRWESLSKPPYKLELLEGVVRDSDHPPYGTDWQGWFDANLDTMDEATAAYAHSQPVKTEALGNRWNRRVKTLPLKVKHIQVLRGMGTDKISMTLDAPSPFPAAGWEAHIKIETHSNYAVEWLKEVFGVEPDEILDMESIRVPKSG